MNSDPQLADPKPASNSPGSRVILESRGLKKVDGRGERTVPVLRDANLSLRQGEMAAIVAPSVFCGNATSCCRILRLRKT